ncbi:hypothetical protein BESB_011220 [Besnoitia besnoiti]|uniref:Uncharacterized protein n=1 Tax=Besnoitia besnoiti TaxID=94643 RepID=A0A2A9MR23_BESBE|nr:hypothetical protein BESB_011220 [Besnoitia besnoiti]PFH38780.1 hypothetical protein BESB_011220 [Besnoitia besnoiti]
MESETAMVSSTKAQANTAASGERGAGTLCVYVRATRESRKGAAKRDLRLSARHKASNSLLILQVVGTSEVEDRRALPVPERLTAQGRQLRTGRIRKDERHRRLTSISASGEEQRRGHNREMKRIPAQKPSGKAPMHSRHRIMRRYRRRVSASQCVSAQAEVFMALAESANDLSRLTYRRRHPDARKCNFPHPETPSDSVDQRGPSLLGASSASRLSQSPVQPGSQTNSVRASEIVLYQGKLSLRPPVSVGLSRLEYSPLHKSIMEARVRNEFSCDSSDTPLSPSFRVFSLPEDTIGSEEGSAQKPLLCQDTLSVIPAMTAEVGRVPPCCVQVVPSPHPIPSDDSLGGCASEAVYSDKVQTEDNPPHSIRIRHRRTDSGASVDVAAVGSSLGSGEIRQGNAVIAFHCSSASAEAGDLSTEGHDAFRGESKRRKLLPSTRSCPTTVHPEVPALCPQRNALSSGLVDHGMRGDPLHRTIPADARFTSTCPFSMISPQREAGTLGQTRLRGTDDPSSALSKLTHRRSASCQVLEANADERQSEKPGEDPSTDGRCSPVTEEKTDECLTHTDILTSIIGEGVAGVLERGAMTLHKFLGETLSENWGTEIPRLSCRSERSIEAARDSLLRGTQKRKRPHADTSCPSVFDWIDDEWSVCSVLTTRDKAWRSKVGAWAFCNREDEDSGEESQTVIDCCQRVRTDDIMQPERHRLQTPTRTPRPQSGSSAEMEAMPPRISQKLSHTPVLAMASASSGSSASSISQRPCQSAKDPSA